MAILPAAALFIGAIVAAGKTGVIALGYLGFGAAVLWLWASGRTRRGPLAPVVGLSPPHRSGRLNGYSLERLNAERDTASQLPPAGQIPGPVLTGMWARFGDSLLARESAIRQVARAHDWTFVAYDPVLSDRLDTAQVTTYSQSVARNICKAERDGVPTILTDLTGVRYDAERVHDWKKISPLSSTMCVMPFSAPRTLRVVDRRHRFADMRDTERVSQTESIEFNERYRLLGHDSSWVKLVLNPEVLKLLTTTCVSSLVIDGGKLAVVWEPWIEPEDFPGFMAVAVKIRSSALTASAP